MIKMLSIIFFTAVIIFNCSSVMLPFSTNRQMSYAGKFVVDITGSATSLKTTNWKTNSPNFTYNYPSNFLVDRASSNLYLGDHQFGNIGSGISCMVTPLNYSQTGIVFTVKTSNSKNILKLSINYFFYYSWESLAGKVYIKGFILEAKKNISKDSKTTFKVAGSLPAQFSSEKLVALTFISGLELKPTSKDNIVDFSVVTSRYNASAFQITLSSSSATPTYVEQMRLLHIIYDKSFLETNEQDYSYRFYSGVQKSAANSKSITVKQSHEPADFNTLVGAFAYSSSKQATIGFSSSVDDQASSITLSSVSPIASFTLNYLVVQSNYCSYKTPFLLYLQDSLECFSECPGSTVGSQSSLFCECQDEDGNLQQDINACLSRRLRMLQITPLPTNIQTSSQPQTPSFSELLNQHAQKRTR